MRLIITGGAGCLGSNLIEKFFSDDVSICVIDNFSTGKREVISEQNGIKIIEGSITNKDLVDQVFSDFKPTHVIHSAASYKDPANWIEDTKTNVLGSIYVGEASQKLGVKRLINFQTALCYGKPSQIPIPVHHPTTPFTSYGISKTAGEAYLMQLDLPVVSLRLANICAPRLAIGPIPTFYDRLKNNKDCFCSDTVRDFLDIKDFFRIIDLAMEDDAPIGCYNVSSGVGHSIHDVFCAVTNFLEIPTPEVPIVEPNDDDVAEVVLDPSVTESAFGWKAEIDFSETINNQLKWYDQFGVNDIYSHLSVPKELS